MKDSNKIDNLFKDGHQKEYPFDPSLWAAMNQELIALQNPWYKQKKYIAMLVILVAGVAGLWAFLANHDSSQLSQNTVVKTQTEPEGKLESASTSSQLISSNIETSKPITNSTPTPSNPDISKTNLTKTNSPENPVSNPEKASSEKATTPPVSAKNPNQVPPTVGTTAPPAQNKPEENTTPNPNQDPSTAGTTGTPTKNEGEGNPNTNPDEPTAENPNQYVMPTAPLWWKINSRIPSDFDLPDFDMLNLGTSCISSYGKKKKYRTWYSTITFEHLIAVNGKKIIELPDQKLLDYRNNSESFSGAQEMNLMISLNHKNFFIQTGIGQKTIQEKVSYFRDVVATNQRVVDGELRIVQENYLKDGRLVTLLAREKKIENVYDTSNQNFFERTNRFSYMQVPLQIGFKKRIQRMEFGVWGLTDVMFFRSFQGQYIEGDVNSFPIVSTPSANKVNLDVGFGAKTSYAWKSNFNVGLSFQQKYMLKSTHVDLNQKFNVSYVGWFISHSF